MSKVKSGLDGYEIEDRFPGYFSETSGAVTSPGDRKADVTLSDAVDGTGLCAFRCRYFKASDDCTLHVILPSGYVGAMQVYRGVNTERVDQFLITGSDTGISIEIWD